MQATGSPSTIPHLAKTAKCGARVRGGRGKRSRRCHRRPRGLVSSGIFLSSPRWVYHPSKPIAGLPGSPGKIFGWWPWRHSPQKAALLCRLVGPQFRNGPSPPQQANNGLARGPFSVEYALTRSLPCGPRRMATSVVWAAVHLPAFPVAANSRTQSESPQQAERRACRGPRTTGERGAGARKQRVSAILRSSNGREEDRQS